MAATFLFIFESIGTQELILIGIIALIFLGPRKLPDIARKIGKVMADFRATTNEFKTTWEREVNFEEEARALRTGDLPAETAPIPRENSILPPKPAADFQRPEIKEVDPSIFEDDAQKEIAPSLEESPQTTEPTPVTDSNAKENWL